MPNTAVYDAANKILCLNGTVNFAGTLWIRYIQSTPDFDEDSNPIWVFPTYSHILLASFAVGIHKGGVDFDSVNQAMAPDNRATAELIVKQFENWDTDSSLPRSPATIRINWKTISGLTRSIYEKETLLVLQKRRKS